MAEKIVSKDQINFAIDVLIAMAVEEIVENTGKKPKEVLSDFIVSKTGKLLCDEKTKLWCNGPSYIADMYREEKQLNS